MQNFFKLKPKIDYLKSLTRKEVVYLSFIGLSIFASILYQILNKAPQKWDSAAHINLAMLYANELLELNFFEVLTLSGYYPPFVHILGALFYIVFHFFNSPLILSFFFLILGVVFMSKLIYSLTRNRELAFFSGTLFALIPQIYIETRLFQLDLPLTVLITMCLYFLFNCASFSSRKYTVLFFIVAAFAQLTKWYAFVYLLVPVNYIVTTTFNQLQREKALKNFLLGLCLALAIAVPWYAINSDSIFTFFSSVAAIGEKNDPQNILSLDSILEYFRLTFAFQLSFPLFLLTLASMVYLWLKQRKTAALLSLAIAVPWIAFTLLKNKDVRYIMPLVPFYILTMALAFHELGNLITKHINSTLKWILLGYLGILFLVISFNQLTGLKGPVRILGQIYAGPSNKYNWFSQSTNEYAYKTSDWQIQNMYNYMVNDLDQYNAKTGKIMFAVDYQYFNSINFDSLQIFNATYYKATAGYDIRELDVNSYDSIKRVLAPYAYVVTAYNPGDTNLNHYDNMVKINRFIQQQGSEFFESKASYKLPNGEEVYLFRNKQPSLFKSF